MKYFVVFASLFVVALASSDVCYNTISNSIARGQDTKTIAGSTNCTSKYGGMEKGDKTLVELQKFTNLHLKRSLQYLLMSTHFMNYEQNRHGFAKLYRKFSDSAWEDSIKLIKYITKRGGYHSFKVEHNDVESDETAYQQEELPSLSLAVDLQKVLAKKAINIHMDVIHHNDHDPEMAHYIEEEFAEKHAEEIRQLTGYVNDLNFMQKEGTAQLSLYLFDEYLQKL